jgi:hypothetical protein
MSVKDWNMSVLNGMSRLRQVPVCHDRLREDLYEDSYSVRYICKTGGRLNAPKRA